MEKIYMEDNNEKQKSKFRQVMGSQVPHHLSALMIMVAFVSFIAIQFSGKDSYAIMYDKDTVGNTIVTDQTNTQTSTFRTLMGNESGGNETNNYSTPYMFAKNSESNSTVFNIQLFCLQKDGDIPTGGTTYTRSTEKVDPAIVYILSKSGTHGLGKYTDTWVTQTAIWLYAREKGYAKNTWIKDGVDQYPTMFANIQNDTIIRYVNTSVPDSGEEPAVTSKIYKTYVEPLVAQAKKAKSNTLTITKSSDEITVTGDNKYYKSPMITVSGLQEGETYSIKSEFPSGTKLYTESGKEITDLSKITASKFYMLVPIANVTEKTKKVTLSVTGPVPTAYVFNPPSGTNYQTVTVLEKETVNTGLELDYQPSVPDTGMNTAQSVYFIGLVILLCGLGIIYANAKSKVSEQD